MEPGAGEQARIQEMLAEHGITRIEQDPASGIPIFHFGKPIRRNIWLEDERGEAVSADLEGILAIYFNPTELLFRGVRGDNLNLILKTGHDIQGVGPDGETYASPYMQKATEYGEGKPVVLIYDEAALRLVPGKPHTYQFIDNPKQALKGILVFDNILED